MNLKIEIDQLLTEELLSELIQIRRHLHQNPELSFEEYNTSVYIRELLDEWDIEYTFPIVKTILPISLNAYF